MQLLLVVLLFLSAAYAEHDISAAHVRQFQDYMRQYRKPYLNYATSHPLYQKRFQAFRTSLHRIEKHNAQFDQGIYTFTLGLNDIADLTDEEYKQLLGYRKKQATKETVDASKTFSLDSNFDKASLPDSWDWREYDAVNPVKNQGQCGSCWAFSAVASMECVYANTTGKLVSFSEQELVDCCDNGQDTCNRGGEMQHGFTEIIKHHGGKIDPEDVYKYTATSKGVCRAKDDKALGHFTSFVNVKSGDEEAVRAAVATKAVLSIAIDASPFAFQLYHHGVFNWPLCKNKSDDLDHGVALVGYGVYKKKDFWLVRNSWGSTWGMEGYIMMSRNKKNQCGVATDASYPIMAKEEIQSITAIM